MDIFDGIGSNQYTAYDAEILIFFHKPFFRISILSGILGRTHARLAQLVEHHIDIVGVVGSSPAPRTH